MANGSASAVCQPRPLAWLTMIEPGRAWLMARTIAAAACLGSGSPVEMSHWMARKP